MKKFNTSQLKMFKNIKHSILSEIDLLWKTDFVNFKIEKTLMSYDIILNDELKIFGDFDYENKVITEFRICFKKTIYSKRRSDNDLIKNQIEFYLNDEDFNLIDIENIEKVFYILTENENVLERLHLDQESIQNKSSDKTSFLELVVDFIEDKKKSNYKINR